LNTRAVALALGVLAAIALTWLGFNLFSSDPPAARVVREHPAKMDGPSQIADSSSDHAAPASTNEAPPPIDDATADTASGQDVSSANEAFVSSPTTQQADATPLPINQVIPDVPQSALQTIRGTVRVTVQVSIDKAGAVLAVTSKVPGPSRYFERLSVEAARKWTFTPSAADEERTMMIRFHYTREGATAHPNLPE
jgi:TonB family protein